MFDLALVRAALVENMQALKAAEEITQVSAYMLANPTPPSIDVMGPEDIDYLIAMQRGGDSIHIVVRAVIALASDVGGQKRLDRLLASSGSSSMKEALESDDTLGGIVDDVTVTRCTGYQVYPRANGDVVGAAWTVQIESSH